MELTGEKVIRAPQERLYDALHDPVVLRQVLPGCQSLTRTADGRYQVTSHLKVGPIKASITTTVEVFNEDRPAGYSIHALSNIGQSGSGAGTAHVALAPVDAERTNLAYHITAELDGPLSELEEDVLQERARTLATEFFSRLELVMEGEEEGAATLADAAPQTEPAVTAAPADAAATGRHEPQAPPAGDTHVSPGAARSDVLGAYRGAGEESPATPRAAEPPAEAPRAEAPAPGEAPYGGRRESFGQHRREEVQMAPPEADRRSNIGRWLLVALGILVIAFLLSDGF